MSEIFPLEVRAKAIAVFFAIAQCFGALGPVIYGALIGDGSDPVLLFLGYLLGAGVMIIGGLVAGSSRSMPKASRWRTSPPRCPPPEPSDDGVRSVQRVPPGPTRPERRAGRQAIAVETYVHHRAVTLAASCSAILTAESAGLALQVLTSIMMLFLCASARPQPQPGALAFC